MINVILTPLFHTFHKSGRLNHFLALSCDVVDGFLIFLHSGNVVFE